MLEHFIFITLTESKEKEKGNARWKLTFSILYCFVVERSCWNEIQVTSAVGLLRSLGEPFSASFDFFFWLLCPCWVLGESLCGGCCVSSDQNSCLIRVTASQWAVWRYENQGLKYDNLVSSVMRKGCAR